MNRKEAAITIGSFYSRRVEEREWKLQNKECREFNIKIKAAIKIQAFVRGFLDCKRLLARWKEEIREQIRSRKRKYREDVRKRNAEQKKMQDDATLRLTTIKKHTKNEEVTRKVSPKRTNKEISDHLLVMQAREKKKEADALEHQQKIDSLKRMQKYVVAETSPRLLVPKRQPIINSQVDEVEDKSSKHLWKSHVTPKSTIALKNISDSLEKISVDNESTVFITTPILYEPSPPKNMSKRSTSRNTSRTIITPGISNNNITVIPPSDDITSNGTIFSDPVNMQASKICISGDYASANMDYEKAKTKKTRQVNKGPVCVKSTASRTLNKPHTSTAAISEHNTRKLKLNRASGVLSTSSKLSNESNKKKNIIILSEKVEEEILRSSLLTKPLPKLMPNMREKELIKLAKLRSLILDTYNPLTGIFGGVDSDKISMRLHYAETYAVNRLLKEKEKEKERQQLRQEYMLDMKYKAAKQRKKVKELHAALLSRAKYEEEIRTKKYIKDLKSSMSRNRKQQNITQSIGMKKKKELGDDNTVGTSRSDPSGYAAEVIASSINDEAISPLTRDIESMGQIPPLSTNNSIVEQESKAARHQAFTLYDGFKKRFNL